MAASSSISECVIDTSRGRISFLEAGAGPAMVLLHGIGSGASSWRAQLQDLSGIRRVIAWNAPGYGASEPLKDDAPDVSDYARSLRAFLDALGVTACDLVGHSLGALIAANFARLYPEAVKTLTLAGCAIGHARLEPSERERLLASRIGDLERLGARGMAEKRGPRLVTSGASDELRQQVVDTMARVDPGGYAQASRMLSKGDMLADLEVLAPEMQVQFIYGAQDAITPPEANLRAAAMRPAASVHIVEAAGHALYIEQAAYFTALLRGFVGAADA